VGISGGPDSTALLLWLVEKGWPVVAAHYDHALREGSEQDRTITFDLCRRARVALIWERRQEPLRERPGSLQAAARILRYGFLERARAAAGCQVIAVGHTADDVIEGVLLHLLRGSGLAGLRGMPQQNGRVVRPFWRTWRAEVEAYLKCRGERPVRDPSNLEVDRFARAQARHRLLPALERSRPGIGSRLLSVAEVALDCQKGLEAEAATIGNSLAELRAAAQPVRVEAYRQIYKMLPALGRQHLEDVDRLVLRGQTGDGLDLPRGVRAWLDPGALVMTRGVPQARLPALSTWACPGCRSKDAVHLAPEFKDLQLQVVRRRPGMRLRVGAGTRKLQDLLVDARVPRRLRDLLPLVMAGGRLAWVPGVAADRELTVPTAKPGIHLSLSSVGEKLGW
jgi:tRNA(Ile)-lysidine synthase